MHPMNDDGLGVEAQEILRDALRALEDERVQQLIGDTTHCLDTDRVRRIAADAAVATVHEQRHAVGCVRCRARIEAFQGAKETTPAQICETLLHERRASVPPHWMTFADKRARRLFDALLRNRSWIVSDGVADELRNARRNGASDTELAHLVATLLDAVTAISHDALSPWSIDFDAAWPMFELLRETAKEAAYAEGAIRDQFVTSYARIAIGAPTHLKAVLVDGIDQLAHGEVAEALSTEIAMTDPSDDAQAFLAAQFDPAARAAIGATLQSLLDGLLSAPDDPFELLSRLRVIRRHLADLASRTNGSSAAMEALVAYASDDRASVYLAMEMTRALIGEPVVYANVLSAMLATGRPELLHGVVVGLRRAFESIPSTGDGAPHYTRQGTIWVFAGAPSHPLHDTAVEVARLAAQHPELADSIEWFNHRFEPTAQSVLEKVK